METKQVLTDSRFDAACAICGRMAFLGGSFALGCWLWPDGFLFGPTAALTPKIVWLAAASMVLIGVTCVTLLFAAVEGVATLVRGRQ